MTHIDYEITLSQLPPLDPQDNNSGEGSLRTPRPHVEDWDLEVVETRPLTVRLHIQ